MEMNCTLIWLKELEVGKEHQGITNEVLNRNFWNNHNWCISLYSFDIKYKTLLFRREEWGNRKPDFKNQVFVFYSERSKPMTLRKENKTEHYDKPRQNMFNFLSGCTGTQRDDRQKVKMYQSKATIVAVSAFEIKMHDWLKALQDIGNKNNDTSVRVQGTVE